MELLYLWVGKYKNIENLGLVINSQYEESQKAEYKNSSLKINLKKKKTSINIFENNIITIIGKNGSGKSNLVNALSAIIRSMNGKKVDIEDYDDNNPPLMFCLVFKKLGHYYFYSQGIENIEVLVNEKIVSKMSILNTNVAKFVPFLRIDDSKVLELGNTNEEILHKKIKNYFYYDRFRNIETKKMLAMLFKNKNLKLFEDNPHLYFEKAGYEYNLMDEIPKLNTQLIQARNFLSKVYDISTSSSSVISSLTYSIRTILTKFSYYKRNKKNGFQQLIDKYFPMICFAKILTMLMNLILYLPEEDYIVKTVLDFLKKLSYKKQHQEKQIRLDFYNDCLNGFLDLSMNLRDSKKKFFYPDIVAVNAVLIEHYIRIVIDFENRSTEKFKEFEKFELTFSNKDLVIRQKTSTLLHVSKMFLNLTDNEVDSVYKFLFDINFYKESQGEFFSFKDLSTGEQRILRILSDINILKDDWLETEDGNNIIVDTFIFDEMDLSWHPEWQRKMVCYILEILNSKNKNIIFTTHSPIILSDMPRSNVILLEKDKNGLTLIRENSFETFGANIHDLYNNDFFFNCEGSCTMGEFAKKQIQSILKDLESKKNYLQTDYGVIEKKIEIIGEPIIKKHLLDILYSKLIHFQKEPSVEYLLAQNKALLERIKDLENEKN